MREFDIAVVRFVNQFAGRSDLFDRFVLDVMQQDSLKLLPVVACLVYLWLSPDAAGRRRRAVVNGMVGGFLALVVTRLIQNLSPHMPRPALSGEFDFVMPAGGMASDWSSFPSDTAGLAFALAFAVWQGSRRLGSLVLPWAAIMICFPRLYGGYHYPSDLLAGAAIGIAMTWGFSRLTLSGRSAMLVQAWSVRRPGLFYALGFIICFQMATYFGDVRRTASGALEAVGIVRVGDDDVGTASDFAVPP